MLQQTGMHCFISGKVQGVWYRASTQEKARSLGLTGWARNLADGRVEVKAFGSSDKLQQLFAWLKIGPEKAEVAAVTYEEIIWENHERFRVK